MKIPTTNVQKWSKLTKYCYDIQKNCKKCDYFPDDLKPKCKVKYHVDILKVKLGEPISEDE